VRVVRPALGQQAVRQRIFLVEREETAPRRAVAVLYESARLVDQPHSGAELYAPAEVEIAAEAARGIESAHAVEYLAPARGVGGLRERQHGMAERSVGRQRADRLVPLDEPFGSPGLDWSGSETDAVGFEGGGKGADPAPIGNTVCIREREDAPARV